MRCRSCETVWVVSGPSGAHAEHADAEHAQLEAQDPAPASERQARDEQARAHVVRRGAEREKRDLFAPRALDTGAVRQTLKPGPPTSDDDTRPPSRRGGHLAERGESSVLFTLASLGRGARAQIPEPEVSPASSTTASDDDGIIDLQALAAATPNGGVRAPVPPLFSDPPLAAFTRDADSRSAEHAVLPASRGRKTAMVGIVAAAAVAALVCIGVALSFRGEEPRPVAALAPPPPPPPAAVVAPAPSPEPAAVSTSTGDDAQAPAPTATKKGKPGKPGKSTTTPYKAPKTETAPKAAAPKAASDPCGCKGDFTCVLACTVKKGK